MKKTLSILLALVLVLTSCFVAAAETTEVITTDINTAAAWKSVSPTSGVDINCPISDATDFPAGVNSAILLDYGRDGAAVTNIAVEENTEYIFSFKAYSDTVVAINNANFIFTSVSVGDSSAVPADANYVGKISLAHYSWGYEGLDGNILTSDGPAQNARNNSFKPTMTAGIWNSFEIKFNSGNLTEVKLILNKLNNAAACYIADVMVYPTENTTGWTQVDSNGDKLTTGTICATGKENEIYMDILGTAAIKTVAVQKNTNYVFSFKAFSNKVTAAGNSNVIFNSVAVGDASAVPADTVYAGKISFAHYNWGYEGLDGNVLTASPADANKNYSLTTNMTAGVWNSFAIKFNSGELTEVKLILHKLQNTAPCYIAEVMVYPTENTTGWTQVDSNGDKLTTGTICATGKENEIYMDILGTAAVKTVAVQKNTNYVFSFKAFSNKVTAAGNSNVIFNSVAVGDASAVPADTVYAGKISFAHYNWGYEGLDGNVLTASPAEADKNKSLTTNMTAGVWNNFEIRFNSGDLTEVKLILHKLQNTAPCYIADVQLTVNHSIYFENPDNWKASVIGSSSPCKNILVDGISDTTVATAITWAKYTNPSTTESGSGLSLLIDNPNHVSQIKLPNIETGSTYRLKFAYKPTGGAEGSNVLNFVGIFDPEFTQSKITADSSLTYSDLKTGFVAVDAYNILRAGRYRFENGVYADNCTYGSLNENIYNESEWRYEELYFKASQGLDNLYLLISYTTEAGTLLVDNFEFEKVDLNSTFTVDGESAPVSMRKATDGGVKQAIRYKFTVDNAIKANGTQGYELIEYGAVAASNSWLGAGELPEYDLATGEGKATEINNKKSVVGVAYNKAAGKDVIFEADEYYTVYSAALYNIGYNKSNGTTDYQMWATDYIVRPYAVYYNEAAGHTVLVYGNEASASVFAVMNEILNSDNAEDKEYVENLLSDDEILSEYQAKYPDGESEALTIQKKNNG